MLVIGQSRDWGWLLLLLLLGLQELLQWRLTELWLGLGGLLLLLLLELGLLLLLLLLLLD